MAIEEPSFEVVTKNEVYEVRRYEPILVAQVEVQGNFDSAGNTAFRTLAAFIFGNNKSKKKIDMTAPVIQEPETEKIAMTAPVTQINSGDKEGTFIIQFTMPKSYSMETLPEPLDPSVQIRQIPAKKRAVLVYSGRWTEERYNEKLNLLQRTLERDGLKTIGQPTFARYNSPYQLWFLRRNEIWLEIN
ncbi:MAG: hypothetical protein RJB66_982 [Pseudomonadota bacterium]